MKILQIHKYYSRQRGGGSVSSFFETIALLEKKNHDVVVFSMHDANNEASVYSRHFAKHFDIRKATLLQKIFLLPRTIYNREAAKKIEQLIIDERPDVAHVHNIYHYLTPSILHVLKKHKIPTVFKLSDYYALSPNYKLFTRGEIDHSGSSGKYYQIFLNKSINNSYAESFVGMCEGYVHRWLQSFDAVDIFLAPSDFMRKLCISYGIAQERITLLRNVLNFDAYTPERKKKKFFLYMGRLSEEKGIVTLLDAIAILKKEDVLHQFIGVIAGTGPQEKLLQKYAQEKQIADVVSFVGHHEKHSEKWTTLMQQATFSVLPSVWYDNSPIAISESLAHATPVIVSDCGGTKEMIEDGVSGFVYDHRDAHALAEKIRILITDQSRAQKMGNVARQRVEEINSEATYYETLMNAYQQAIAQKKKLTK